MVSLKMSGWFSPQTGNSASMKAHPRAALMCLWQGCIRSSSCLPVVNKKFKYYEKNWRFLAAERGLCRGICNSEASVIFHNNMIRAGQMESLSTPKN